MFFNNFLRYSNVAAHSSFPLKQEHCYHVAYIEAKVMDIVKTFYLINKLSQSSHVESSATLNVHHLAPAAGII